MSDTPKDTNATGSAGTHRRQWQTPELTEIPISEVTGSTVATSGNDGSNTYHNS